MRYAICYVSTVSNEVKLDEIKKLLKFTEQYNNEHDIRGVLLYADGNFFQILEGDKNLVEDVLQILKKDERHKNIIQVVGKNLKQGPLMVLKRR